MSLKLTKPMMRNGRNELRKTYPGQGDTFCMTIAAPLPDVEADLVREMGAILSLSIHEKGVQERLQRRNNLGHMTNSNPPHLNWLIKTPLRRL